MSWAALPEREANACSSCGCAISADAELCADCGSAVEAEHSGHALVLDRPGERRRREPPPRREPAPEHTVSRRRHALCGDISPTGSHYVCTRPPGHRGEHVAHGADEPPQVLAAWPRDTWVAK